MTSKEVLKTLAFPTESTKHVLPRNAGRKIKVACAAARSHMLVFFYIWGVGSQK